MSSIAAEGKGEPNTVEEETWPAPYLSGESCKQTALTLTATIPWPILSWLHRRRVVISPPTRFIGSSRVRILLAWAETKSAGGLTFVLAYCAQQIIWPLSLPALQQTRVERYGEGGGMPVPHSTDCRKESL